MLDNDLIVAALRNGQGGGCFAVTDIRCTDPHLQGHAFKYASAESGSRGVFSYRLDYVDAAGKARSVDAVVKAKPDQTAILAVYQSLLDRCGIALTRPLAQLLAGSDYSLPNLKEAVLFRDFAEHLAPYLPRSLGVYIDEASGYTLRIEERLALGSVIVDPDDDTTARWSSSFSALTLEGLADIHARFYGKVDGLLATDCLFACTSSVMTGASELWQAFRSFLGDAYGELVDGPRGRRHQEFLDTLPSWYAHVETQPMTLLYGDVNPQNLAFAATDGGFRLSVFDWERAVISLPQKDLAEFLVYTLPADFTRDEAITPIDHYRDAFGRATMTHVDAGVFAQGLVWMLRDLILNRLPLMMVVAHVAGKRLHAADAYANAHRLLELVA